MKPVKSNDFHELLKEDCPACGADIQWEINKYPRDETDWFYNGTCTNPRCEKIYVIEPDSYVFDEA